MIQDIYPLSQTDNISFSHILKYLVQNNISFCPHQANRNCCIYLTMFPSGWRNMLQENFQLPHFQLQSITRHIQDSFLIVFALQEMLCLLKQISMPFDFLGLLVDIHGLTQMTRNVQKAYKACDIPCRKLIKGEIYLQKSSTINFPTSNMLDQTCSFDLNERSNNGI